MYILVGLGNPTEEYENTRHNAGRDALEYVRKKEKFPEWEFDKKLNAQITEGKIGKAKVMLVCPDTFMNKSGTTVQKLVKSKKAAQEMLVVYDDLDLPIGKIKISYNKSSGGHNGLESIIRAVKTQEFPRIRIGVSPGTPSGKIRKLEGEKKVLGFLLGKFTKGDQEKLSKVYKMVHEAITVATTEGHVMAMNKCN